MVIEMFQENGESMHESLIENEEIMSNFSNKIAFIIATKNRRERLHHMLESLNNQSVHPDLIIIVDGGTQLVKDVQEDFPELNLIYKTFFPASAAKQRNFGLGEVSTDITLVGFLDDDVELDSLATERLLSFWENAPAPIAGTALNMMNHPRLFASSLKYLPFAESLGLYSKKQGDVLPSAFQTMIGTVKNDVYVNWLPTGAVVWRKNIFEDYIFDEWFTDYSYLEDLDFSYRVGKKFRLMVLGEAKYYHYPALGGRGSDYRFGLREVKNRLYLVKKHSEFSLIKCYLALFVRMMMNIGFFLGEQSFHYFQRAMGNAAGLISSVLRI
ncbi:glycosyltransferase family 2 protein [Acidobacteriota bacterium]